MIMVASAGGIAALIALLWIAGGIRRIGSVSDGDQIEKREGTALILIDLQEVFWDHGPYKTHDKAEAEAAILEEINAAKESGCPVIAVRQEWSIPSTKIIARLTMKGQAIAGTPGTQLAHPFAHVADHVLVKRVQDAFETGELDALLAQLDVGRLRLVGLDFNYCVQKTALSARNRGYHVSVNQRGTLSAGSTAQTVKRMEANGVVLQ